MSKKINIPRVEDFDSPLTPRRLFELAEFAGVADARLRICDGMAVSYFPRVDAVCLAKDKIVIDVSAEECYEYDELAANDRVILYSIRGGWYSVPEVEGLD